MQRKFSLTFKHIARTNALSGRLETMLSGLHRINPRISDGRLTIEGESPRSGSTGRYFIKLAVSVPGAQIHADNQHAAPGASKNLLLSARSVIRNAKKQLMELRERRSEMDDRAA